MLISEIIALALKLENAKLAAQNKQKIYEQNKNNNTQMLFEIIKDNVECENSWPEIALQGGCYFLSRVALKDDYEKWQIALRHKNRLQRKWNKILSGH